MRNLLAGFMLLFSTLLHASEFGRIVFTEVMADPEPVVGLAAAEYLELFNRTNTDIVLNGWMLQDENKSYAIPSGVLPAKSHAILCSAASVGNFPAVRTFPMQAFPSLTNSGRLINLVKGTQVVAWIAYSAKWYTNPFKSEGGWSLECVDPDNLSGLSGNWRECTDLRGGTPGEINSVDADYPDLTLPVMQRISVVKPNQLRLRFDRYVDTNSLTAAHFVINPFRTLVVRAVADPFDQRIAELTLSDTLESSTAYELTIKGVQDAAGYELPDTVLSFGLPETPFAGDLVFNELMFNPLPAGVDYIELAVTGDRCVDPAVLRLTRRLDDGTLDTPCVLTREREPFMPGTYWLLTTSPEAVYKSGPFPLPPHVLTLSSLPVMPDSGGTVLLTDVSGRVLDSVVYNKSQHFALIQDAEGVALEKISLWTSSGVAGNWTSASSSSHFGTPGFVNSHFADSEQNNQDGFSVFRNWMTPNNDGLEDAVEINYCFENVRAGQLRIFTLSGRSVRILADAQLLDRRGCIRWDGTDDSGTSVQPGRYVLYASAADANGRTIQQKIALTVLF